MLRALFLVLVLVATCYAGDDGGFFNDVTPLDGSSCGTTGFVTVRGNFSEYSYDSGDWGNSGSGADNVCYGNFITNTTSVTSFTYYLTNDNLEGGGTHIPSPSYGIIVDLFNDPSSAVAITLLPNAQLIAANRTYIPNFAAVTANFGTPVALTASHVYILLFCANGTGNEYDAVFVFLSADDTYDGVNAGTSCGTRTAHQCRYEDWREEDDQRALATSVVCTGTATSAPATTTTATTTTNTASTATTNSATTATTSNTSGSPASTLSVWWKFW